MPIAYLDPQEVTGKKQTAAPRSRSRSGYGPKEPTSWMLQVGGVWRRVYVAIFSNAGSAYVLQKGERLFLGSYDPRDN